MIKFEVGKTYRVCRSDLFKSYLYKVTKRTASYVTMESVETGTKYSRKPTQIDGSEWLAITMSKGISAQNEERSERAIRTETGETSKEEKTMKKVTVKELREHAKAAGIKGYSRMKKAELEAALSETIKEETRMKQAEYFMKEQSKLGRDVIAALRATEISSEKTRILEDADYFMLEGVARELGMELPEMPEEERLRERLIAVFVKPEETRTEKTEEETIKTTETIRDTEMDIYESLGIYVSDEERELMAMVDKANEVCRCGTYEEMLSKLRSYDPETAINVCYMFFPDCRGQMPEAETDVEVERCAKRLYKTLTERMTEEVRMEDQMPLLEADNSGETETPEEETIETESLASEDEIIETVRIELDAIRMEADAKKREEMLRGIEDARLIEGIAKELYGADYVRELLIEAMKGKECMQSWSRSETEREARPVSVEEFKKAFDEIEGGKIYVSIPKLRKKLKWGHEEFDEMVRELRDKEEIILHVSEAGKYDPEEFIYDENDGSRMGLITWKEGEAA